MSASADERGAPPDSIRPAPLSVGASAPADALTTAEWERLLRAALGEPVEVRYGRARRSVVRVFARSGVRVVHLSAFFARAPVPVRAALASWLRSGKRARRASELLDAWIAEQLALLEPRPRRAIAARTSGAHHDLAALARELLAHEFLADFAAQPAPEVTWGRAGRSRSRRSLRLGSFDFHARVVRIHPVLDQAAVPATFVKFVLFHELLHAALGEDTLNGRRVHHGPPFRARERRYRDYDAALAWEREWIRPLIRSARSGEPLKTRPASKPRASKPRATAALKSTPPAKSAPSKQPDAKRPRDWRQRVMFD